MHYLKARLYQFLRWSEKYTKTDMVYLSSGGFWLVLRQSLQMLLGLLLLTAFANLLTQETYGTYQFVVSLSSMVGLLTLTGMGTSIMRSAAKGNSGALRQGFKTQMQWNIGIVMGAGVLAIYYYLSDHTLLFWSLIIVGSLQPFISGFTLYQDFLIGRQAFKVQSILDISRRLIPTIALLACVLLTNNLLALVFSYFSSHALSLGIAYYITSHRFSRQSAEDPSITSYSKHLSVMGAISKASEQADKILLWHFMGPVAVAVYTIAQVPISHMKSFSQLLYGLVFPKLTQKDLSFLTYTLPDKIRRYFLLVVTIVIIYIVLAPYLFAILFPKYPEGILYSQLLALSLLAIPRALIGQTFVAHERKRELYTLNVTTPAVRLTALLVLLPPYGILGAIAALLLAEAWSTILHWYQFSRIQRHYSNN